MELRNRVVGFDKVPASSLIVNQDNVRFHPPDQMATMTALLDEIGMSDAILVRKIEAGYEILDGHMRRQLLSEEIVPIVILDLNDEETYSFLLTFDAVKAMSTRNTANTNLLLDKVLAETGLVRQMLNEMSDGSAQKLAMQKGNDQTRNRSEVLIVGKYRILLTNAEAAKLMLLARAYADQRGSYLNFINHVLDRIKKNRDRLQLPASGTSGSGVQPSEDQPS